MLFKNLNQPSRTQTRKNESRRNPPNSDTSHFKAVGKPEKRKQDEIAIVGYHHSSFVRSSFRPAGDHELNAKIKDLPNRIGEGMNLASALDRSIDLLCKRPKNMFRRIWLISNGKVDCHADKIMRLTEHAAEHRININCIPVGVGFNLKRLGAIAHATHNGLLISLGAFRRETNKLVTSGVKQRRTGNHKSESTVICVDMSHKMLDDLDGHPAIKTACELANRIVDMKRRLHC